MYSCRTWERAKAKLPHYRRRQPEESPLYRIVYHGREELPRVWEEKFQPTYGVLRDEVLETFDEYLNCGLLQHGAARVYCENCKHSLLVAFSCKKRGLCPSCNAKRAVKFGEHLYDAVLWYSCRARGERAKRAPVLNDAATLEARELPAVSWAACMKRVFEINPLECPRCKSQMRIVAFLADEREIIRIADSLCIPRAQAPPKIRRPPQPESFWPLPARRLQRLAPLQENCTQASTKNALATLLPKPRHPIPLEVHHSAPVRRLSWRTCARRLHGTSMRLTHPPAHYQDCPISSDD